MKNLFLLLFVGLGLNAQVIEFEDKYVKGYLLSSDVDRSIAEDKNGNNIKIDENNDGEFQLSEIKKVEKLYLIDISTFSWLSSAKNYNDLAFFENLKFIEVAVKWSKPNLDFSSNIKLKRITIRHSSRVNLNTSKNEELEYLKIDGGSSPTSNLTLDLSKNLKLNQLIIEDIDMDSLDVSNNIGLKHLEVYRNNLDAIDLSSNSELEYLSFREVPISVLDISNNKSLKFLVLSPNHHIEGEIDNLDLTNNIKLKDIKIHSHPITELDISNCEELISLGFSGNHLKGLDVSNNKILEKLNVNSESNISLLNNLELRDLLIRSEKINSVDISQNKKLTSLYLDSPIDKIDVTSNVLLDSLKCYNTKMTELNVSSNTKLKLIDTGFSTTIKSLNVSNNKDLKYLLCFTENRDLDVSNNLKLEVLIGKLTESFDISKYVFIKDVTVYLDSISEINFYNNPDLEKLSVYLPKVKHLDFSKNPKLKSLKIHSESLESLNIKSILKGSYYLQFSLTHAPSLRYICVNDSKVKYIEKEIEEKGLEDIVLNSYCSFVSSGETNIFKSSIKNCENYESIYSNLKLNIKGINNNEEGVIVPNLNGEFINYLAKGEYLITPSIENSNYYSVKPENILIEFKGEDEVLTQDFCIDFKENVNDLDIYLTPSVARPGFNAKYKITYSNIGTIESGAIIELNYQSDKIDFIESSLPSLNIGNGKISWNIESIKPFEKESFIVTFNLNSPMETPPINLGDILNYSVSIISDKTDDDLSNNTSEIRQTVVGSHDPNDKTCLEGTEVLEEMIGEYVHYKIRFENKGTFAAENIVVVDEIDETKFDLSTLTPLDASHDFETRIKENKVEFIFEGVQLPYDAKDSSDTVNTDDNNDGYMVFKIKTLPTLKLGDSFSNQASIYFDFNFPIITNNETTTIVEQHLSVSDFEFNQELTLYPNPVQDRLYITSNSDTKVLSLEIYNLQGQLIQSVPEVTKMSFDVSRLSKGTYLVSIKTDKGVGVSKMVKE